jgi:hypothetical protein
MNSSQRIVNKISSFTGEKNDEQDNIDITTKIFWVKDSMKLMKNNCIRLSMLSYKSKKFTLYIVHTIYTYRS